MTEEGRVSYYGSTKERDTDLKRRQFEDSGVVITSCEDKPQLRAMIWEKQKNQSQQICKNKYCSLVKQIAFFKIEI